MIDFILNAFTSGFDFLGDMLSHLFSLLAKPLSYIYYFFEGIFYFIYKLFEVIVKIIMIFVALIQFFGSIVVGFLRSIYGMLTIDFNKTSVNMPSASQSGLTAVYDLLKPTGLMTVAPSVLLALLWGYFIKKIIGLLGGEIKADA